jgi:hypothetical protein
VRWHKIFSVAILFESYKFFLLKFYVLARRRGFIALFKSYDTVTYSVS